MILRNLDTAFDSMKPMTSTWAISFKAKPMRNMKTISNPFTVMLLLASTFLFLIYIIRPPLPSFFVPNPSTRPVVSSDTTSSLDTRTLLPLTFTPLPLGSIKATPNTWLDHELHASAQGLAGHLYEFYAYVKNSSWLGGDPAIGEYSGLNEGFPYWFNGLVALAYSLPDHDSDAKRLRAQVHDAADTVLRAQTEDGWLGPEDAPSGRRLHWGRFPFLLGLKGLVEANETGWGSRGVDAMRRYVALMHDMLKDNGKGLLYQGPGYQPFEGDFDWGRVRVADAMITLQWLLDEQPGTADETGVVWECMEMLYSGSLKWEAWYNEATYIFSDLYRVPDEEAKPNYPYEHGVNIAQGLKAPAVVHRYTHNTSLVQTQFKAVDWSFRYHGAASGTILADERIDGLSPYSGSELCTAVEAIFSLSYLYQALGTNDYADRAELAGFNALPVMMMSDHWAHQYVAQPNQPWSQNLHVSPFSNTNSWSQTFGLEPHYPCCTVNHPQGLPKFLAGSWIQVGKDGLAHALLSPGSVSIDGVSVRCETDYPFGDQLTYKVESNKPFEFFVRVPGWFERSSSRLRVMGAQWQNLRPSESTGLHRLLLPAGSTTITYDIGAVIRTMRRANDTIAVYRGALLFALEVSATTLSTPPRRYSNQERLPASYAPPKVRDWTMKNASAWNIAIDPATLSYHRTSDTKLDVAAFAPGGPPNYMTAQGCEIEWPLFLNITPGAPPQLEDRKCMSPPYEVRLVPYGSAKLHMAELPVINLESSV